jgi:hypothetical protein
MHCLGEQFVDWDNAKRRDPECVWLGAYRRIPPLYIWHIYIYIYIYTYAYVVGSVFVCAYSCIHTYVLVFVCAYSCIHTYVLGAIVAQGWPEHLPLLFSLPPPLWSGPREGVESSMKEEVTVRTMPPLWHLCGHSLPPLWQPPLWQHRHPAARLAEVPGASALHPVALAYSHPLWEHSGCFAIP